MLVEALLLDLAKRLRRPQSFIAKYEGGERRIDVIEFIEIARGLNADPLKLFRDFLTEKPVRTPAKRAIRLLVNPLDFGLLWSGTAAR